MDCFEMLRRLHEIERAIGALDSISLRKMIIDAEDFVVQSQKHSVQTARSSDLRMVPGK